VLRWRQHGMVRAWAAWRHVLNLACRLKMMGRKIVQRWMRLGLAFAFVPWHYCYVANARLAYVARKISDAHAKAVCLQVVATWCVEAHMNAALHLRGCQLEGKGKYALHMRGFGAWAMHATLARRLRLRTLRVCCRHAVVQSAVLFKAWLLLRQRSHVLWQKQQRMRIKHAREILRERCAKWGAITRTARCHTAAGLRVSHKWAQCVLLWSWRGWGAFCHANWLDRVSQSQHQMAHALGGSVIGAVLEESTAKDYRLAAAVKEISALKNIINAQQKQLVFEQHERETLKDSLRDEIENKFSALKAVCPAGPGDNDWRGEWRQGFDEKGSAHPATVVGQLMSDATSSLFSVILTPNDKQISDDSRRDRDSRHISDAYSNSRHISDAYSDSRHTPPPAFSDDSKRDSRHMSAAYSDSRHASTAYTPCSSGGHLAAHSPVSPSGSAGWDMFESRLDASDASRSVSYPPGQGSSGAISHGGQEGGRAGGDRARTHSVTLSAQESVCDWHVRNVHAQDDDAAPRARTSLGMKLQGLVVADMTLGGPAHQSGLVHIGDLLLEADGEKLTCVSQALQGH